MTGRDIYGIFRAGLCIRKIMSDVVEYRQILQVQCARLAIERWSREVLDILGEWCGSFEREVARYYTLTTLEAREDSFVKTVDNSLGFHTQLCKMSDNELLCLSFCVAKEPIRKHMLMNASVRINNFDKANKNIWVDSHWGVYFSLEKKDYAACCCHLLRLISGDSDAARETLQNVQPLHGTSSKE